MKKEKKVFHSLMEIDREYFPEHFKQYLEELKKKNEEFNKKFGIIFPTGSSDDIHNLL